MGLKVSKRESWRERFCLGDFFFDVWRLLKFALDLYFHRGE
jgi:hypothetical protein